MPLTPREIFDNCTTLMLDMDGTLLDLAFDNYMWNVLVPEAYAQRHGLLPDHARKELYARYRSVAGRLDWYCLDHWSRELGLDILALHRQTSDRIGWLPGAKSFLEAASLRDVRVLLVSNSHPDTLAVKTAVTGIAQYFDGVYLSHQLGHAKEEHTFWQRLHEREAFDVTRTLFVDDTETVLSSAGRFGVRNLMAVLRPDTSAPARSRTAFTGIDSVAELI